MSNLIFTMPTIQRLSEELFKVCGVPMMNPVSQMILYFPQPHCDVKTHNWDHVIVMSPVVAFFNTGYTAIFVLNQSRIALWRSKISCLVVKPSWVTQLIWPHSISFRLQVNRINRPVSMTFCHFALQFWQSWHFYSWFLLEFSGTNFLFQVLMQKLCILQMVHHCITTIL